MFAPARAPDDALRAVLVTLAPALFAPVLVPGELVARGVPPFAFAAVGALGLMGATVAFSRWSRILPTFGLLLALSGWIASHPHRPGIGLVGMLATGALLTAVWPERRDHRASPFADLSPISASALVAVGLAWFGWTASLRGPGGDLAIAGSALVVGLQARQAATVRLERQLASVAALWPIAYAMLRLGDVVGGHAVPTLAFGPLLLLSRSVPPASVWRPVWRLLLEVVVVHPPRLLVASFGLCTAFGTALLALPIADRRGVGLDLVDAAFTSVSAVCVTGLTVVEPGRLSGFGELVLVALVQIGGLGIMSFASVAVLHGVVRIGRNESIASMLGQGVRADLLQSLRQLLRLTFVIEGTAAALLLPALVSEGRGIRSPWEAVFLAVSAFNNAGFAPGGSLHPHARHPWLLLVVGAVALLGSLGPALLVAARDLGQGRKVPMYTKLSLVVTAVLLVVPFGLVLGLEWSNLLRGLPAVDRLVNAALLTVAPRSSGFTTLDLSRAEPATLTLWMGLMFVGGATGSTAGGVKVTTIGVLMLAAWATIRGRRNAEFGSRQIPHRTVYEAVAVVAGGLLTVWLGFVLLQLTQRLPFQVALFDVVSAVSTAGLSVGGADHVDSVGKIVLAACMFAGRVGPLTLLLLWSHDKEREGGSGWPSEEVPVG